MATDAHTTTLTLTEGAFELTHVGTVIMKAKSQFLIKQDAEM